MATLKQLDTRMLSLLMCFVDNAEVSSNSAQFVIKLLLLALGFTSCIQHNEFTLSYNLYIQARLIYFYEMTLPARMQTLYLEHIHTKCNPLEKYYDDDEDGSTDKPAELKKIAHQINVSICDLF